MSRRPDILQLHPLYPVLAHCVYLLCSLTHSTFIYSFNNPITIELCLIHDGCLATLRPSIISVFACHMCATCFWVRYSCILNHSFI